MSEQPFLARMPRVRPLASFAAAWCAGAWVAYHYGVSWIAALALGVLLVPGSIFAHRRKWQGAAALACAAALFLGAAWTQARIEARPTVTGASDAQIEGRVVGDPYRDEDRLVFRLTDISVNGQPVPYDAKVYLTGIAKALRDIGYADRVRISGNLWDPDEATNPYEFDYRSYLWQDGIAACVNGSLSGDVEQGRGILSPLYSVRHALSDRIDRLFPASSELAKALVLGDRSGLDGDVTEDFRLAGAAHLLAVSGMHVSVLAMLFSYLIGWALPKKAAYGITLCLLGLYACLTGLSDSILRAFFMYAILGAESISGAPSDGVTRLSAALLLILLIRPLAIASAGFCLSFGACAGILLLARPMAHAFGTERLKEKGGLGRRIASRALSACAVTLAAQIGTLPGIANSFGTLPLCSVISNLLVVPVTLLSFGATLLGLVLPFFSGIGDGLLRATMYLVALMSRLPLAHFTLPHMPGILEAGYIVMLVASSSLSRLSRRKKLAAVLMMPGLVALSAVLAFFGTLGLRVLFLDAGQANAAVVYAGGAAYLVDTGDTYTPVADYLQATGTRLRAVILTHPDSDHAAGLKEVLQISPPEEIWVPCFWYDIPDVNEEILQGMELAQEMGIPVVLLSAGDELTLPGSNLLRVYSPDAAGEAGSSNEISLVFAVFHGDGTVVFTGDLPIYEEPDTLPDADVLSVAHHGSAYSTSLFSLYDMSPSVAVISVGRNWYGHPSPDVIERLQAVGCRIARTDECGCVDVRIFSNGIVYVKETK